MEYQFLLLNLCDLVVVGDIGVDDDDLAKLVTELGIPSISNVHLVKERGNSLFREGNFVLAARHYIQALKLVCFLGLPPIHDQPVATSLCLSLVLNLAGCELKLSQYNRACCYCTFVLSFDPSNVKALYRRGLAFKHLNLLNKALEDFDHAVKFDPLNKDVNRELHSLADLLILNVNGKRVACPFNPLGSDKKGKKPLLANEVVDKSAIHVGLNEASCSRAPLVTDHDSPPHFEVTVSSPMVTDHVYPPHTEVTSTSASIIDSDLANVTGSLFAATDIIPDSGHLNEASPALSAKDDCIPSNTNYSFSNKNHPKNNLRLSSQDYENLLCGRDILYFHPRSLSSLRVRPLISTNSISTGTPHEEISREAAVPIPYPLHEVRHQHSHLHSGSESYQLGQEEAVSHVAKKKRLLSDSSLDSILSMVQFQFVAVKESLSRKCCRKVEHSIHRGRMVKSGLNSRKKSLGFVHNLPSFCRYTEKVVAVTSSKRKEVDLIQFEDYYHPPFKKCRLSFSVSFACNFSPASSVSSSLGVSNSPMFVW